MRARRTAADNTIAMIETIAKRSSQALWCGPRLAFGVDVGTLEGSDVDEGIASDSDADESTAVDESIDVGIAIEGDITNDVSSGIDMLEWIINPEMVLSTAELALAVVE
jgi:hypothetical protein